MQANQEHIDIDTDAESDRRPYQAPTLTFEGSLDELTLMAGVCSLLW